MKSIDSKRTIMKILLIVSICFNIILLSGCVLFSRREYTSIDDENYMKFNQYTNDVFTQQFAHIFPELSIIESNKVLDYKYVYDEEDAYEFPSFCIRLYIEYNESDFDKEVERLALISNSRINFDNSIVSDYSGDNLYHLVEKSNYISWIDGHKHGICYTISNEKRKQIVYGIIYTSDINENIDNYCFRDFEYLLAAYANDSKGNTEQK